MALQFYFGASGTGKSQSLYDLAIQVSLEKPEQKILFIVPDQFTMQTQMDLVKRHPHGGILNIDVLSFGRLTHRIVEEIGGLKQPVLDDTGKCLLLQKIASNMAKELPIIGKNLHKQGYIHEVKSIISEFMQYGIGQADMDKMQQITRSKGMLNQKLADLKLLYSAFMQYKKEHYITTEETLEVVKEALKDSDIVKDAIIIFDGFTGFTPIQNLVIRELLLYARDVIMSLTIPRECEPYKLEGEQDLFALPKKTVKQLCTMTKELGVTRKEDVILSENVRHKDCPVLTHLEKNLFRYPSHPYIDYVDEVMLTGADNIMDEIRQVGYEIRRLLREGHEYRNIAIVCGDLSGYSHQVERVFHKLNIPYYIDQTTNILLNPMIEFVKSALGMVYQDFSYASVFQYLRSGMTDFNPLDIDKLEEYVLRFGIRGRKKWMNPFTYAYKDMEEGELEQINQWREALIQSVAPFLQTEGKVSVYVKVLYQFIVDNRLGEKLAELEAYFTEKNELSKAKEYSQIYTMVLKLLEQIYELLGDEEMSLKEFADILEAGFGEIEIGSIPQNVDRIVVGDMERSRLREVQFLFFVGVNEGNIPKSNAKGGLLSELDREFMKEKGVELAPGSREQMYIQRLYLYLNMTKPTKRLYVSYSRVDGEGKVIRPSYLIGVLKKLFPQVSAVANKEDALYGIETLSDSKDYAASRLQRYVEGRLPEEEEKVLFTLMKVLGEENKHTWERLVDAAFIKYENHPLAKQLARLLYGTYLKSSISRLENYAACAYRHFLQYGLGLKEREEFSIQATDVGNVFHGVLEEFAKRLEEQGETMESFSKEQGIDLLHQAMETYCTIYHGDLFQSSERNAYALERMERILLRTVFTLQEHLKKGRFHPESFEMTFSMTNQLKDVELALSDRERMQIQGRIDRVDTYQKEDHIYVKVIDYKSGNRKFDLLGVYYGLQLQLVVYMDAAMNVERKLHKGKEVVPAAMLYYQVKDPIVEETEDMSDEMLETAIGNELRMDGMVNSDSEIIGYLDSTGAAKSYIIPVDRKTDGSFKASSSVMTTEQLEDVTRFVRTKVKALGREILDGNISVNPYHTEKNDACTYCSYKGICGYDESIRGYHKRKIENMEEEQILHKMHEESEE